MCPPDHFAVEYEINPWMKVQNAVDRPRAQQQWQELFLTYRRLGQTVELAQPMPGNPDMVFTANAGVVRNGKAVLSHFHHPERQGEEPFWWAAFHNRGYQVTLMPKDVSFEGAGDALFVGERLFCGYGFRTDRASHELVRDALDVEVVSLELVDPSFYHLDTCFCPLSKDVVMFAPEAFSATSAKLIRRMVRHVIEVPTSVALDFVCNGVTIGDQVVSSTGLENLAEDLHHAGFRTTSLPMTEFMKAGGGVRCLSLFLD
jgi:N-dimethylarginine dimethylaminohydrolase